MLLKSYFSCRNPGVQCRGKAGNSLAGKHPRVHFSWKRETTIIIVARKKKVRSRLLVFTCAAAFEMYRRKCFLYIDIMYDYKYCYDFIVIALIKYG